jgi:hypothetical protein
LSKDESRLPAIGFQWADRVPWLTQSPGTLSVVDAAFRLEMNNYYGDNSLQARLVALSPHGTSPAATATAASPPVAAGD